ncbi:hypothetical protein CRUP_011011 [Coryphaenoides rupestris]|nr:hypothetical protein CRUP_011011 [Coryphaenoides rupestris]
MGANTSQVTDLSENPSLRTLVGTESVTENAPFWNQLISFTFISPANSGDSKLLEEAVIPLAKTLNGGGEDLLEELMSNLVHLIVEVPLL